MTLSGCFVTPHPPIIVPEVGGGRLGEVADTVRAMELAGERVTALSPDAIVLLSPHAPLSFRHMGVSLAGAYEGSLAQFGAPRVTVRASGDEGLAAEIVTAGERRGVPVTAIASPQDLVQLDHGSMVPLVYLTSGLEQGWRLVLLSFSGLSISDHVRFGEVVGGVLLDVSERVVYVASADLSHRLIPGAPAGYDHRGIEFDCLIADTFAAGDWDGLLSIDPTTTTAAGECGYRSLAVLSGVVAAAEAAGRQTQNHLFSYEGPFGVGYMVGEVEIAQAAGDAGTE